MCYSDAMDYDESGELLCCSRPVACESSSMASWKVILPKRAVAEVQAPGAFVIRSLVVFIIKIQLVGFAYAI